MNRRTRIVTTALAIVALLGAAYVGVSAWLGRQFEQGWQNDLDRLAAMLGSARVIEHSYQRHLLGAQATLVLEVPSLPLLFGAGGHTATHPLRLYLQNDVRHGPLTAAGLATAVMETTLLRVEGADDDLRQAFAKVSPPRITSVFSFGGSARHHIQLPPGEMTLAIPLPVVAGPKEYRTFTLLARWQQADYDVTTSEQGRRQQGRTRMPNMSLQMDIGLSRRLQLQMEDEQTQFDLHYQGEPWLMGVGDVQSSTGRIELRTLDAANVAGAEPASAPGNTPPETGDAKSWLLLQNARFEAHSTQQGTLMNATYLLDGKGSAVGVPMENLHFELMLSKLDLKVLADLQTQLQHLAANAQAGDHGPDVGDDADSSAKLEALATRLMDAGPGYTLKFNGTLNGQTGSIGYGLRVQPSPAASAPDTSADLPAMPLKMQMDRRLVLDASLRLPKTWLSIIGKTFFRQNPDDDENPAEMLTKMAQGFTAEGWLRDEGEAYATDAKLEKGALQINGRTLGRRP